MNYSIEELLRSHYVDGVYHTHVSMIKPMGKFQFNRQNIETFWEIYCDKIKNEENPIVGIAEKPLHYLPVLVDIDIKLPFDEDALYLPNQHLYSKEQLMIVVQTYQQVLREIVDEITDEHLTCLVLEKKIYHTEQSGKKYTKNGFHLHFPWIFLNKDDQSVHLIPRVKKIIKELNLFSNLGFEDSSKLVDDAVLTAPWLLYGSCKQEGMEPYKLTKIIDCNLNFIKSQNDAFKHYKIFDNNERPLNIRNRVGYYLPRILSIIPYGRDNLEMKSNLPLPVDESKPKPVRNTESKYEGKQYEKNMEKDMQMAYKLLPLLNSNRAVERDTWTQVGFALHHISEGNDEGKEMFINFSDRAGEAFDEAGCEQFWNSLTYREAGYNLGSLRNWAKADSPDAYKQLVNDLSSGAVNKKLRECLCGSHGNFADLFRYTYGKTNIRILNQEPSRMKFAHWNEEKALWTIEKKIVLSRLISTELTPLFEKWYMELWQKQANQEEDEAEKDSSKTTMGKIKKIINNLSSTTYLNNIVSFYCSYDIDKNFENKLNSKPNELPLRGGKVINLKTKEVRERTSDDLFSFELNVDYIQDCDYSRVLKFFSSLCVDENKQTDFDLVDYHKRLWGYSMTGEISDRSLHILWGNGKNGKSKLLGIIHKILGEYSISCNEKVLMSRDNGSTSPEMVRLLGARLAELSETKKDDELNGTRIKSITGGDNIVARGLYQDEIQFKMQATLIMLTNNKPTFDITDQAMLDRIKLLPFLARFENLPENNDYIESLMNNHLDEFFSWFADGAFEWYAGKRLVPCQIMSHQMKNYINELDIQGQFIEERIAIITKEEYGKLSKEDKLKSRIKKDAFYGIFTLYTMELGVKSKLSKSDFYKGLEKYKIEMMKSNGIRYYLCKEKQFKAEADNDDEI